MMLAGMVSSGSQYFGKLNIPLFNNVKTATTISNVAETHTVVLCETDKPSPLSWADKRREPVER